AFDSGSDRLRVVRVPRDIDGDVDIPEPRRSFPLSRPGMGLPTMNLCFGGSDVCFICGKEITGYRVHLDGWKGEEYIDIDLHRDWADFMASGLKRDVLEFALGPQTAEFWYRKLGGQRAACLDRKNNDVQPIPEVAEAIQSKYF